MSLPFHTRWRMFLAKSRSGTRELTDAWRYLVLGGVKNRAPVRDVLHPNPTPSLCTCYGPQRAGREAYDDHEDGCPWLDARCDECLGEGYCRICGGAGLHPIQEVKP